MASLIHLDTHVVVWLFAGQLERLPKLARQRLESAELGVSPMVLLELSYLEEIGRLRVASPLVIEDLERRIGLRVVDTPFAMVVARARELSFTRDPFDRIIGANALVEDAPLLSADASLRQHLPQLVLWD